MTATVTTPTLAERLAAAREDEEKARVRVAKAEPALKAAVDGGDFKQADKLKAELEAAREDLLIKSAHAEALQAGIDDLERQRAEERAAQAEYERIEHAKQLYEDARIREATILDEVQHHIAQIDPAYEALRRVMQEAVDAEHRLGSVRNEMHQLGQAAGFIDPGLPLPPRPNQAQMTIDSSGILARVHRMPATH